MMRQAWHQRMVHCLEWAARHRGLLCWSPVQWTPVAQPERSAETTHSSVSSGCRSAHGTRILVLALLPALLMLLMALLALMMPQASSILQHDMHMSCEICL